MDHGHVFAAQAQYPHMTIDSSPASSLFAPIAPADEAIRTAAYRRLDSLTKPLGSLGRLEQLAAQVCAVQRTLKIKITRPTCVVFAADHGAAVSGVSAYPREVTAQMVENFLRGGAAISVLADLEELDLWIVDAGVAATCTAHPRLIEAKVESGTRNFIEEPAMTSSECTQALLRGRGVIENKMRPASNTLILGEMGIGNTASAALLMHGLTGHPLSQCVGRGTGLDDGGLERKRNLLDQAFARRAVPPQGAFEWLTEYGGYEIAMLVGAMMAGAARGALIMVDGFTVTVAATIAIALNPRVKDYCVFSHCSAEHGHRALLDHLDVKPLLDLSMRLGEGSGAAVALPILRAAACLFTQMATFESAGVSNKAG
jgi:nicotinate-nucleotide--dimethylbenzimidazole phosphoribosyltransferase